MRVPSGNEPGGFTSGGIPKAVVNTIKRDEYIVKNIFKCLGDKL